MDNNREVFLTDVARCARRCSSDELLATVVPQQRSDGSLQIEVTWRNGEKWHILTIEDREVWDLSQTSHPDIDLTQGQVYIEDWGSYAMGIVEDGLFDMFKYPFCTRQSRGTHPHTK